MTALFNTNVMVLPVAVADLGLTAEQSTFSYRVETRLIIRDFFMPGPALDVSPRLTYDANDSPGILLLHAFNAQNERAEVVRINDDFQVYLPTIHR